MASARPTNLTDEPTPTATPQHVTDDTIPFGPSQSDEPTPADATRIAPDTPDFTSSDLTKQ